MMTDSEILSYVDHTLLSAAASWEGIKRLCGESIEYGTASVCIPPSYVRGVFGEYSGRVRICTVIGFPLGYSAAGVKAAEAETAVLDGADEIDMVVNLGDVKNGSFGRVTEEIRLLKEIAGGRILKVIVETCYLTEEEKVRLCGCVTEGGADFIKTSTGFGPAGATISDISLFKGRIGPGVRIKAAGGIKTREEMVSYIEAGCARLGTSSAVKILKGGLSGAGGY